MCARHAEIAVSAADLQAALARITPEPEHDADNTPDLSHLNWVDGFTWEGANPPVPPSTPTENLQEEDNFTWDTWNPTPSPPRSSNPDLATVSDTTMTNTNRRPLRIILRVGGQRPDISTTTPAAPTTDESSQNTTQAQEPDARTSNTRSRKRKERGDES